MSLSILTNPLVIERKLNVHKVTRRRPHWSLSTPPENIRKSGVL